MDGHRRYADEPEKPSWYSAPGQYASPSPYESGVHERPSGAFRLPEQRVDDPGYAPYTAPDPVSTSGSHAVTAEDSGSGRLPVRGPEYPTIRPQGADAAPGTYGRPSSVPAANEPTSAVPQVAYRSRRPVSALVVAVVAVLLMVPVVLLLVHVTFVADLSVRGVVPAVLLALGLPLTGIGLYSLAAGGGPTGRDAWLRPPIAYLPVGLLLLLAAGLAVA